MEQAKTIDEVIIQLQLVIHQEINKNSALAFFAVLYLKVTHRIKEGILQNEFANNQRMELLDVIFANRYIAAYYNYINGKPTTKSWKVTFEAAKTSNLLILQQLLLGINAHINLDLGISVSQTVGEQENIEDFKEDFDSINDILASMVDEVQDRIGRISPLFYLLEKVGKGREDAIVSFSIDVARGGAWVFAKDYHFASDKDAKREQRDEKIAALAAKLTTTKSRWLRWTLKSIRFLEAKDIKYVTNVLGS